MLSNDQIRLVAIIVIVAMLLAGVATFLGVVIG